MQKIPVVLAVNKCESPTVGDLQVISTKRWAAAARGIPHSQQDSATVLAAWFGQVEWSGDIVAAKSQLMCARHHLSQAADFYALGMGTPWPVSGLHGSGMGDVMDELIKPFGEANAHDGGEEVDELRIAILGRPNVRS